MPHFRAKPVVIEAVQLTWENWNAVCALAGVGELKEGKPMGCFIDDNGQPLPEGKGSETMGLLIPTLEGLMVAKQTDWIVKGTVGEIYPVKDAIFRKKYSPASKDAAMQLVKYPQDEEGNDILPFPGLDEANRLLAAQARDDSNTETSE